MPARNPYVIDAFRLKSGERIYLSDLEKHGLSYVPCDHHSPAVDRYAHLWNDRKQVTLASYGETETDHCVFKQMQGVQIMTGQPTFLPSDISPSGFLHLMDFDIENRVKSVYPEHYQHLINTIYAHHKRRTPCHIRTKRDGDRFSLYVPGFGNKVSYTDKASDAMLFEFFSKNGLSRLDNRYALVKGSLFDIPQFHTAEEVNALTGAICVILEEIGTRYQSKSANGAEVVDRSQIGDLDIEWRQTKITKEDGTSYDALVSQRFPTENCQKTEHRSNRDEVSFTQFQNGSVLGHCFNCGESWWEIKTSPKFSELLTPEEEQAQVERLIANAPPPDGPPPPKVKLKKVDTAIEAVALQSLKAEREQRDAAADAFLDADVDTDVVRIILVGGWTGTGKSHTYIAKAGEKKRRTLAPCPHKDLAVQAVATARELGFQNPVHLKGREHNWESSEIAAIPEANRTVSLFSKNNCLMVDELKRYTEKRVARRTYCEMKCRFRVDGEGKLICPHLLQFKAAAESDFLATCSPNLLFDPHLHGYLETLVNLKYEESLEEEVLGAALGVESEKNTENPFDLAIVDDYDINGLYTDVTLRKSEFKRLRKLWQGAPTGDFAELMLKAFKKKKPAAIFKRLRRAFEKTSDHHAQIAEDLTHHVLVGILTRPERLLGSKASGRILAEKQVRFEDGETSWVPVDWDAYKELVAKSVSVIRPNLLNTSSLVGETVHLPLLPLEALRTGVPISKLTPLWQNGTTPIDLLRILIASVGTDGNVPIHKSYTAGDPPDTLLTFSIPPQAPVGILSNIAMLSATTNPESTKNALRRQRVDFSEFRAGDLPFANDVQVSQFSDARLTSASVFKYADAYDKRKAVALTPSAAHRLAKLNTWAAAVDGVTAFVSFKEFTEDFSGVVKDFDIVTHFDRVAGLNFDGLKFLVIFGYPKVNHLDVMNHAKKQFAADVEPLPKGNYMELTEEVTATENGIRITERRYIDPRLERIRHQLASEKLEQASGRGRFFTWEGTRNVIFTSAPLSFTDRTVLFSSDAFRVATSPEDLAMAMARIEAAVASGDVKAVMRTKGVTERTAYRQMRGHMAAQRDSEKVSRNAEILRLAGEGKSQRKIQRLMKKQGWTSVYPKVISEVISGVHKN